MKQQAFKEWSTKHVIMTLAISYGYGVALDIMYLRTFSTCFTAALRQG